MNDGHRLASTHTPAPPCPAGQTQGRVLGGGHPDYADASPLIWHARRPFWTSCPAGGGGPFLKEVTSLMAVLVDLYEASVTEAAALGLEPIAGDPSVSELEEQPPVSMRLMRGKTQILPMTSGRRRGRSG